MSYLRFTFHQRETSNTLVYHVENHDGVFCLYEPKAPKFYFDDKKEFYKFMLIFFIQIHTTVHDLEKAVKIQLLVPKDRLEDGLRYFDDHVSFHIKSIVSGFTEKQLNYALNLLIDLPISLKKFDTSTVYFKSESSTDVHYLATKGKEYHFYEALEVSKTFYIVRKQAHAQKFLDSNYENEIYHLYKGGLPILKCFGKLEDISCLLEKTQ